MMKKLYLLQTIFLSFLFINILLSTYSQYKNFYTFFSFNFFDVIIYISIISSILFSYNKKIISSVIVIIYSVYILVKFVNILDLPAMIFNSIVYNGNYLLGFYYLLIIIDLTIGIILLVIWIDKTSKEDAK